MPLFELLRTLSGRLRVQATDAHGVELRSLAGSNHASAVALAEPARLADSAIFVGIGELEFLPPGDRRILYTDSLQSCFPVIFKYRDGGLALYHGNHAALNDLHQVLNDPQLEEIQLFEKGTRINSAKVGGLVENLKEYYAERSYHPVISHQQATAARMDESTNYNVAVIYRDRAEQPIIFVGVSKYSGGMASALSECSYPDRAVQPYQFEQVQIPSAVVHAVAEHVAISRQVSLHYPNQAHTNNQGRWHAFEVKSKYYEQRGDYLKTTILEDFKNKIDSVCTRDELATLVNQLKDSREYGILATGQGVMTKILGLCAVATTSITAFEAMVEEKRESIERDEQPENRI